MPAVHELWYCVKALSMKVCRYPITSIMMSMNKKVFNFRLKKINTKSAFMSSWRSGYLWPWMTFIVDMIGTNWSIWQVLYPRSIDPENWYTLTGQISWNAWFWIRIDFWLEKRGEGLLLWTKMHMYERLEDIRLLIFFQAKH